MTEQSLEKRSISRLVSLQHEPDGSLFVLSPYGQGKGSIMTRFVRETELLHQARHPNLLRGVQEGSEHNRKAEPLSGCWPGDAEWLSTLSLRQRLRLFAEIASAVGGLHRAGIVYSVLHPDRIGIRANGEAVLLDLGMTWMVGSVRGGGDALDYCAPECFSNRVPDARADIYSLGLLLHYLLTGEPPPPRSRVGQAARLSALPDSLADLQPLLTLMLVDQPAERPSSVTMLLDQLNALMMRSSRLAARLEADRDIGELPFERLLTPLSALSQRPALAVSAGAQVDNIEAGRWDTPAGTGRWSLWSLGLGIPMICGLALLFWLQNRPDQELGLIEKLVLRADTQVKEGKLLLPAEDNALDTLRTLRIADPDNAKLAILSERVEEGAAQFVLETLSQGRLDEADLALSRAIRAFPDDPKLVALSGTLAQARREAEERDRLNRLFAKIDDRLEGRLDTPEATDSVIALLRRAKDLAGENIGVAERRLRLEEVLAEKARAELKKEHLEQAKESMDRLRELAPASTSLAMLEAEYRRLLGAEAHRKQLARLLKDAAEAEKAGVDRPAGLRRALEAYLQVLRLEPDDATAKERVQGLGEVALNDTRRAVEREDWEQARNYLALGYRALPRNSDLAALDARIAEGAREQSAEVRKLLDQADLALRRGNYFTPESRSAWDLYQSARAYPQAEEEVRDGLRRLRAAVLKEVDSLMAQRRYDDAGTLVERARQHIANDAELGRRKLTLASILEQRSTNSAVADGFLAINAIPWAHIHSVKRVGSRQRIALEDDATTPLRLKVPAGDYLIELRNPDDGQLREIRARVQSGQGTNVSVNLRGDQ
ncbi:protein kinase domain-containing protein [Pseudomonas indica]|uniref:protein kinase domain-containing protein n=1 Tax=Pseudomonas indica TaxID=137658 RepID=UPI003FD18F37